MEKSILYEVVYSINDRGRDHPQKKEELAVNSGQSVEHALKKHINKYRHAQDLTKKFIINIISYKHIGYVY